MYNIPAKQEMLSFSRSPHQIELNQEANCADCFNPDRILGIPVQECFPPALIFEKQPKDKVAVRLVCVTIDLSSIM